MSNHYEQLKQYHSALGSIDKCYQELQASRTELLWYESKLNEADTLAVHHGLSKPSSMLQPVETEESLSESQPVETDELAEQHGLSRLPRANSLDVTPLDREYLLNIFENLQKVLVQLQNAQGNFQHRRENITRNYDSEMQSLREKQTSIEEVLKDILSLINSAKMSVFLHLLTISVIITLVGVLSRDAATTGITAIASFFGAAILPIFNSLGLVGAISKISGASKNHREMKLFAKEFYRDLPENEERLLRNKRAQEVELRTELDKLRSLALDRLSLIQGFVLIARHNANEVMPLQLSNEWQKQQRMMFEVIEKLDRPVWNWQEPRWQEKYTAPNRESQCSLFRLGDLLIEREQGNATLPAMVALRAHKQGAKHHWAGHIAIFSNDGDSRQAALCSMESLAVRTIASMSARTCKAIAIDPVNAGNTFPFQNFPNEIVGKQTYTNSNDIREQLHLLTQHVEHVIQKCLTRNYEMIEDYNADGAAIPEAYRYVFIADFPASFDLQSIEHVKSLLLNGARAGVYVVLHIDDSLEKPREFNYELFEEWCTVLRPAYGLTTGGSFQWKGSFKVGYVYLGRVTRILHSGAFVEFLPDREGMLPTAQMTERRIRTPEEAVSIGQLLAVKISSIDGQNRATLSCLDIRPSEVSSVAWFAFQAENFQYEGVPLFTLQLPDGEAFRIRLDTPPVSQQFNQLAAAMREAIRNAPTDVVPFDRLYPKELWTYDSSRSLCAAIGRTGAGEDLEFLVGMYADGSYEPAHALLAGTPGSGKSYTLHSIIFSLALRYSPEELELYLLDYKDGVEFQVYVAPDRLGNPNALSDPDPTRMLPHAKVISIESDVEFGLSVLERAITEMEMRSAAFKSVGASGLESYRKSTGKVFPRLLIVIDEYQQMYLEADSRLCDRLNNALEQITKQGRSYGVHLLLGSQSPRVESFRDRIYEQISIRMAMNMSQSTAGRIMAEGNAGVVKLLDRSGKIAYNDHLGEKEWNRIGQVAFIDSNARKSAMEAILKTSSDRGFQRTSPTVVFNGTQPARLKQNAELQALTNCDRWLPSKELNKQYLHERDWMETENPCATWLGESMQIGRQIRPIFRRRPRNNLLLIGTNQNEIFGVLGSMLIGLVHTCLPDSIEFKIANLSQSEGEIAELMPKFRSGFNSHFDIQIGNRFADKEQQIARAETIWQQVTEEFDRRQAIRQSDPDTTDFGKSLFFIFALGSLTQMDRFRPIRGKTSEEISPDTRELLEITSNGSELGIHIVLWLNDFKTFQQLFCSNYRSVLPYFDLRVALKMTDRESEGFLGQGIAKNLRDSQAYFTDASTPDDPEKFRPCAVLSEPMIEIYAQALKQRK
jgi:DNA segregation ATPase FtsK/SpoIIIE, S-DNA-T family